MNHHTKCFLKLLGAPIIIGATVVLVLVGMVPMVLIMTTGCGEGNSLDNYIFGPLDWYRGL